MISDFVRKFGLLLEAFFDRIVAVAGAIVFIQIPSFLVQYQQRLGGHVDELARLIRKYKIAAADNGRTVEEYIGLHLQSNIKEFVSTGKLMSENMERFTDLSSALKSITESKGIIKLFQFLKNIDMEIFKGALKNFVPGISFSIDTLLYGFLGIVLSMIIYHIIRRLIILVYSLAKGR